ncbi:MAG TPA: UDP-N-acetylmuramate--L-alanine ligase [Puia sp.]|nr:UDP-N-acetylmuramate--L-alanine ligase [Puia sp.]
MVDLNDIKKIYFIGIGGIGMSALARYFRFHGKEVSGYDRVSTTLTRQLEAEGIAIHYEDDPAGAPRDADLVVYTPAIPGDHRELRWYREQGYPLYKRSDVLGMITDSSFNICVAGTHGKTTVTTMIAHILRHSGYGCNAFLGGISVNYNSNYWSDRRNVCVVEADEYDRSFLKLSPDIAVITAMDADHLDIYGTAEAVEEAFIDFAGRIKTGGLLLSKKGLAHEAALSGDRPALGGDHHWTYGLTADADVFASEIRIDDGDYWFTVQTAGWKLERVVLSMGGRHNVENVTAAIAIAHHLGIAGDKIIDAVAAFRGVKRRFEYVVKTPDRVYIDDYAHHPEELRALITGARELFPGRKCTVIFQPHLFTRTRDFADGFAASLDLADEVFLLPIYPARELPLAGVTSKLIADKMSPRKVKVVDKEELLTIIQQQWMNEKGKVLITAGAGDIDTLVEPIRRLLSRDGGC